MRDETMYYGNSYRPAKDEIRDVVVGSKTKTPKKVALFITVPGVPDIKAALKSGLINKQTKIIAINHCRDNQVYSRKLATQLRSSLTRTRLDFVFVDDYFESATGVAAIQAAAKKWGKIDFAFIDLCGMVSPSICYALNQLQSSFATNACVALTSLMEIRRRTSIHSFMELFGKLDERALQIFSTPDSSHWLSDIFGSHWTRHAARTRWSTKEKATAGRKNNVTNFVWQWQAASAALDGWNIRVTNAIKYGDCLNMGVVIFNLTGKKTPGEFGAIRAICEPKGVGVTKPGFSPAKQAWITRCERHLAGRFDNGIFLSDNHVRAKLASLIQERDGIVETETESSPDDRQAMLSRRAHKAWATRRRNAAAK